MGYLLDTNILIRLFDRKSLDYSKVYASVDSLKSQDETLCFAPQNAAEFWNVATRPLDKSGLGLTVDETEPLLAKIEELFTVLLDTPSMYSIWRSLVRTARVSGVQVHDARLVAWMQAHSISHILTLNTRDFKRYTSIAGIVVVSPQDIVGA